MPFTKIAEGYDATTDDSYPHAAMVGDKIWLWQTKYLAQPTYNWGHRVSFAGGHASNFDLSSSKWSPSFEVAPISTDENLEEAIFVLGARIFILLFSAHHGLNFQKLSEWDQEKHHWTACNFEVAPEAHIPGSNESGRADVFVVPSGDNSAYVISYKDQNVVINHLTITDHREFKLSPFLTIPNDLQIPLSKPVNAAVYGHRMVIINGQHGCGFRWDPMRWLVVDLEKKTTDAITLADSDQPSFAFSGARATAMLDDGRWAHITGSKQIGMTGSEFNGEIWTVDLKQFMSNYNDAKWIKSPVSAPSNLNSDSIFIAANRANGDVFMGDSKTGLFKAQL